MCFATVGTCYSVRVFATVCYQKWNEIPLCITDSLKNTVVSPDDGPIVARNV